MTRLSRATLLLLAIVSSGCATTQLHQVETTVRIESQPPGAFVSYSAVNSYREGSAVAMGKTPLIRYQPLPETGATVQLTLRGYKPWTGPLSPSAPTIKATLEPLSDAEKQAAGWVTSTPIERIAIVPIRIGTQKIGDAFQPDSPAFRNSFLSDFQQVMHARFGEKASAAGAPALEGSSTVMEALEASVKGIDMSQLAARSTPLVIELPAESQTALAQLGGAVLFVRAEAYYLGGGARFARVAIPILLTLASAAGGAAAANATGASFYTFYVNGPGPTRDTVLAQAFLVHAQTRELLWFGQAVAPAHYEDPGVIDQVATKLAEQVPSAVLKGN